MPVLAFSRTPNGSIYDLERQVSMFDFQHDPGVRMTVSLPFLQYLRHVDFHRHVPSLCLLSPRGPKTEDSRRKSSRSQVIRPQGPTSTLDLQALKPSSPQALKPEARSQKPEDRRQKTEDRRQADDSGRRLEWTVLTLLSDRESRMSRGNGYGPQGASPREGGRGRRHPSWRAGGRPPRPGVDLFAVLGISTTPSSLSLAWAAAAMTGRETNTRLNFSHDGGMYM